MPPSAFSNGKILADYGLNGKCATGSASDGSQESFPWCYVKESCRPGDKGFLTQDGKPIKSGVSSVPSPPGRIIPWQECSQSDDTSSLAGVQKSVQSGPQCFVTSRCTDPSGVSSVDNTTPYKMCTSEGDTSAFLARGPGS